MIVSVTIDARVPMPEDFDEDRIGAIVQHVLEAESAVGDWEIAIAFMSDDDLRVLHREFMADDTVTDIMTFSNDDTEPWPGSDTVIRGGDIAISVDRAAEQRQDEGWGTAKELEFLVVHGVLHLLGWDDATPEQRSAMLGRQRELLASFTDELTGTS